MDFMVMISSYFKRNRRVRKLRF